MSLRHPVPEEMGRGDARKRHEQYSRDMSNIHESTIEVI